MFRELDPLLHSELRLAVMSILVGVESADFVYLREETGATAGNLSVQIDKLRKAGYISVEKSFRGKMPCTVCRITEQGMDAFEAYVAALQTYIKKIAAPCGSGGYEGTRRIRRRMQDRRNRTQVPPVRERRRKIETRPHPRPGQRRQRTAVSACRSACSRQTALCTALRVAHAIRCHDPKGRNSAAPTASLRKSIRKIPARSRASKLRIVSPEKPHNKQHQ